jgi:phenylacetaldehyde dehydrogenase
MTTPTLDKHVHDFIGTRQQLFIDGQMVEAVSGKTFETVNPATGAILAEVAEGDAGDIDLAVRAARRAFDDGPWSRMTPSERGRIIWMIGDLINEHLEEFAELETLDNGKPLAVARVADVPLAAELFRYMAGWEPRSRGTPFLCRCPTPLELSSTPTP